MQMADLPFVLPLVSRMLQTRPVPYPVFDPAELAQAERDLLRAVVSPEVGLHVAVTKLSSPRVKGFVLTTLDQRVLGVPHLIARVSALTVDRAFPEAEIAPRLLDAARQWAQTALAARGVAPEQRVLEIALPAGVAVPEGAVVYEQRAVWSVANASAAMQGNGHADPSPHLVRSAPGDATLSGDAH